MKLYGIIFDGGDGSVCLRWYSDKEFVDKLLTSDDYCTETYMNEGSPACVLEVPEGVSPEELGIKSYDRG